MVHTKGHRSFYELLLEIIQRYKGGKFMIFYIIDDNPRNVLILMSSLKKVEEECYWIDERGIRHDSGSPTEYLEFPVPLSEDFKKNISEYASKGTMFLVDLALNKAERDTVNDKYVKKLSNASFAADVAAEIIKTLKTASPEINVRLISAIWRPWQKHEWKTALKSINTEEWFNSLTFVPTAVVAEVHEYPDTMVFLCSAKSWEDIKDTIE